MAKIFYETVTDLQARPKFAWSGVDPHDDPGTEPEFVISVVFSGDKVMTEITLAEAEARACYAVLRERFGDGVAKVVKLGV